MLAVFKRECYEYVYASLTARCIAAVEIQSSDDASQSLEFEAARHSSSSHTESLKKCGKAPRAIIFDYASHVLSFLGLAAFKNGVFRLCYCLI